MAVYTEVSDDALVAFLTAYDIGDLVAFRGIAEGVENSNYTLRTTRDDFILTLYEKRVNPKELPWFIGLMDHLAAHGLNCPVPVRGRDGTALRQLCGRPAALTTFLPGVWPRHVQVEHCGPLGHTLAQLHLAGQGYTATRANGLGPQAWRPLLDRCRDRGDEVHPDLCDELDAALDQILDAWPHDLPTGQIHADLFPDNVFFLDGQVSGVIDFLFAATDMYAYDLAICLNAWCFDEHQIFDPAKAHAMLEGYDSVRPLLAAEKQALPVLCQGSAVRFLLTRLFDWLNTPPTALVTRKDPMEYKRKLDVHLGIKDWREYGLS